MNTQPHTKQNKGFAVLYAVLTSSLLLSIGLGIYNISLRELVLSSSASESQIAIFAADTGLECALYWDVKAPETGSRSIFPTSTQSVPLGIPAPCANISNITDTAQSGWVRASGANTTRATTTFTILLYPTTSTLTTATSSCAIVTVGKFTATGVTRTTIDSRGYNTCDLANPRRIERGLRINY